MGSATPTPIPTQTPAVDTNEEVAEFEAAEKKDLYIDMRRWDDLAKNPADADIVYYLVDLMDDVK